MSRPESHMTDDERFALLVGVRGPATCGRRTISASQRTSRCAGYVPGIPRLGFRRC